MKSAPGKESDIQESSAPGTNSLSTRHYLLPYLVYVLPLLAVMWIQLPIWLYVTKNIAVVALILFFFRKYAIAWKGLGWGVICGVVIAGVWAGLGRFSSDPIIADSSFYASKALGMLLAAPLVEELFVRDFLNRIIISPKWQSVPISKITLVSIIATTVFFALSHNFGVLLPAILTGLMLALLLHKTGALGAPIVAHFAANLILWVGALMSGWPQLIA